MPHAMNIYWNCHARIGRGNFHYMFIHVAYDSGAKFAKLLRQKAKHAIVSISVLIVNIYWHLFIKTGVAISLYM